MSTVLFWERSPDWVGPCQIPPAASRGFFVYVIRSPDHSLAKVGIGRRTRLRQWERDRRWRVIQYLHVGEDLTHARRIEDQIKGAVCLMSKDAWPYTYAGFEESWPMAWGCVRLQAFADGTPELAVPEALARAARQHGRRHH